MNKKKLLVFGIVGLFVLTLVSAVTYYAMFSASFTVKEAIDVQGNLIFDGDYYGGQVIDGGEITIKNNAPTERIISITDDSEDDINVSYIGTLELTKKTVDFTKDVWVVLGDKVQIEYTIVGDKFSAEVIAGDRIDYVLIYYVDAEDRFVNPEEAILVESVVGNLPNVDDENADLNDYSVEYPTTPHGAKIWYVPTDAIPEGVINWSRASEFYFETELIQYNDAGQITIYPNQTLTITPVYNIGKYVSGNFNITTTVA